MAALLTVVAIGTFSAATVGFVQQDAQSGGNLAQESRAFAAVDSYRVLVMAGYDPAIVGNMLGAMLYEGEAEVVFNEEGTLSGSLSTGGGAWGYSFDFNRGFRNVGDFAPESLPVGCSWNDQGTEFVCVWTGHEPWLGGLPRGQSKKCGDSWNPDPFFEREFIHRSAWFGLFNYCSAASKGVPDDVSGLGRFDYEFESEDFEGFLKFPEDTRLVVESGAMVSFSGPVVFEGNVIVERGDDRGGDLVFRGPVAILGALDVRGFLDGDMQFLDIEGGSAGHMDWGGSLIFEHDTFIGGSFLAPDMSAMATGEVFARRGWIQGQARGEDFQLATPFWTDDLVTLPLDRGVTVSPRQFIGSPRRVETPARVSFESDVYQGLVGSASERIGVASVAWDVRVKTSVERGRGGKPGDDKGHGTTWQEVDPATVSMDVISIGGSVFTEAVISDLTAPVIDDYTLEELANSAYGSSGWTFVVVDEGT